MFLVHFLRRLVLLNDDLRLEHGSRCCGDLRIPRLSAPAEQDLTSIGSGVLIATYSASTWARRTSNAGGISLADRSPLRRSLTKVVKNSGEASSRRSTEVM